MYRKIIIIFAVLFSGHVSAHQFVPTYPVLKPSTRSGVLETHMELFNTRKDITYYELEVFDSSWQRVPFATYERTFKVEYLKRRSLTIYIRKEDATTATYICTQSKILVGNKQASLVSSRVCSKFKA
jgi:hypothetical protein